jgi:hypothetical protein
MRRSSVSFFLHKELFLFYTPFQEPLLKEVVKQLLDEYAQSIKDITDEAILEMVSGEIQKMAEEQTEK